MNFCLNCNEKLNKIHVKGNNHKYCNITCRNKQKYLKNKKYYKDKAKERRLKNPELTAFETRLWRLNNPEKCKQYIRNYENLKNYNQIWREKNKKFIKLNEQIAWKFGFKLYIQQIRDNYDYYLNLYNNSK